MTAPRPGDPFHLDLDGTVIAGHYIEVDSPHRLLIEWDRHATDNSTPTPALIEFTFTPIGDETSVEVHALRPQRGGCRGLSRTLRSLPRSDRTAVSGAEPGVLRSD